MKILIPELIKKMPKIKLITFDLDDTFWDIKRTIVNAEINSRKWIEDRIERKIEWGTIDDFLKLIMSLLKIIQP